MSLSCRQSIVVSTRRRALRVRVFVRSHINNNSIIISITIKIILTTIKLIIILTINISIINASNKKLL